MPFPELRTEGRLPSHRTKASTVCPRPECEVQEGGASFNLKTRRLPYLALSVELMSATTRTYSAIITGEIVSLPGKGSSTGPRPEGPLIPRAHPD